MYRSSCGTGGASGGQLRAGRRLQAGAAADTFEETVERLGTAIRLGLLAPGSRLPAGARSGRAAPHLALHAAPGADDARPERAPALRARSNGRHLRRRRSAAGGGRLGGNPAGRGRQGRARHARGPGDRRRPARGRAGRRRRLRAPGGADRQHDRRQGVRGLPPGRRALPHRPGGGGALARSRDRDDGDAGPDERPDRPHRAPRRGADAARTRSTAGSSRSRASRTSAARCA